MNYDHDVRAPIPALEHSKFIEIVDDARYPAVSALRIKFPESSSMAPISTTEVYPKHAVLTYIANPEDIYNNITGGGGGSTNVTVNLSSTNALLSGLTAQVTNIQTLVRTVTSQGSELQNLVTTVTAQGSSLQALVTTITAQNAVKVTNWTTVSASVTNIPSSFPSTPASLVSVLNNTGITIKLQNGASLPAFPLPTGGAIDIYTIANANEIILTREDGIATPVEVFGVVTFRS